MGLLSAVVGGAGEGMVTVGKKAGDYLERSNLQSEMADIQAKRDAVLEGYASGREQRGYQHAETMQAQGFRHAEGMQASAQDFTSVENELNREQQTAESALNRASTEKIAKLGRDVQMSIAKMHGTVQIGEGGKILWVGAGGETKDTGYTSIKDLSPTQKVAADILRDQLKALDKSELDGMHKPEDIANQRTRLNGQLLAILTGEVKDALKGPGAPVPSAAHIDALKKNPNRAAEFDSKFGAGASAQYLPKAAPAGGAPAGPAAPKGLLDSEPPDPQAKREADMRADYDRQEAEKKKSGSAYDKNFRDNLERTRLRSEM